MDDQGEGRRIRLLIVHAQATSSDIGGSYTVLRHILRELPRSKFDIHIAFSVIYEELDLYDEALSELRSSDYELHTATIPLNERNVGFVGLIRFVFRLLISTVELVRLIRRLDAEVVYSNSLNILPSGVAAWLTRVPCVYHVHEIVRRPRIVARLLVKTVDFLSDRIVCVSEAAAAPFREAGVEESKVYVIPNCVDVREFHEAVSGEAIREEFGDGSPGVKLVGSIGRLHPKKGHHIVLEAAQRVVQAVPEARFVIVGDTDSVRKKYTEKLVKQVEDLGLKKHVLFTGIRRDMPAVMAGMDVVVLAASSEATPESFGMVLIEAMAVGTPVVATDLGGIPEVIRDGVNGRLVPPNDVDALTSAIERLLNDTDIARRMGEAGRRLVRSQFSTTGFRTRLYGLLEDVVGDKRWSEGEVE